MIPKNKKLLIKPVSLSSERQIFLLSCSNNFFIVKLLSNSLVNANTVRTASSLRRLSVFGALLEKLNKSGLLS